MENNNVTQLERPLAQSEPMPEISREGIAEISVCLRRLLADVFAFYSKTKHFHWHMTGRHFRDYHLLLDEQADHLFAMTDEIAERARKIGGTTLRSVGEISRHERLKDNEKETLTPRGTMTEIYMDNRELTGFLRLTHETCEKHNDIASASLIENWVDEAERRSWFLLEITKDL
jgi:starvation-inducible DNA-binding protein